MMSLRIPFAFAAALLLVPAALAQDAAQQQHAPQANKPVQPDVTKEFGDWTVRCYPVSSPSPCEMLELRVAKKDGQKILGVLLAYIPSRDADVLQISVPLGVALQNGLVINSDTFKSGVLKYRRCDMQGCYVETAIDSKTVGDIGRATKAEAQIIAMDGKRYNLVFSLKGFTDAHRSLVDLAKQKAGGGTAAKP